MRTTPTVVLFVMAVLGVMAVVYMERQGPARVAGETVQKLLFEGDELPVDLVDRISLRRARGEAMVFERHGAAWAQAAPFPHPMDPFSIRQLIALAARLEAVDSVDGSPAAGAESLAALGLEPPLAVIEFHWSTQAGGSRRSIVIRLGRLGIAGRAYLQIDGDDRVYVVNNDLHDRAVEMDVREWRDRTIFHEVGVDSERVAITGAARIELERDRKEWRMVQPVRCRLDPMARDDLFQALGRARVSGFILDQPSDPARFGLVQPVATLTVTGTMAAYHDGAVHHERREQTLRIGSRLGASRQDRFAAIDGRPVVAQVGPETLAALFRTPEALVSPTGSGMLPADVKAMVIRGPGGEFRLERHMEEWIAVDEAMREVPAAAVEELLAQLTSLRAPEVALREYPRELEVATITLFGFDSAPKDTVRIAFDPQRGKWAMENGDNVLRIFPESLKLRLAPGDFGLQSPTE
jgi:hypothetical protein